ncbi:unnamed protein product [Allacma fusca]|uniref:RGS domain-containing protein n=1 Tax=Allacma fusca TaxID=39272 RepID=A0A8J2KTJ4_9HEXA|nr:unnamed protein product [Allacma fusca]
MNHTKLCTLFWSTLTCLGEYLKNVAHSTAGGNSLPWIFEYIATTTYFFRSSLKAVTPGVEKVQDLKTFLKNEDNLNDFTNFTRSTVHATQLDFLWAVAGLKADTLKSKKANVLKVLFAKLLFKKKVVLIHKHLFPNIKISDNVRDKVADKINSGKFTKDIFDEAFDEVFSFVESVLYQEFLRNRATNNKKTFSSHLSPAGRKLSNAIY